MWLKELPAKLFNSKALIPTAFPFLYAYRRGQGNSKGLGHLEKLINIPIRRAALVITCPA
jgi:hypothetical protein